MSTLRKAFGILTGRKTAPLEQRATSYIGTLDSSGIAGGTWTVGDSSVELSSGERDFSASAVAYRCVNFIAGNLASVDMVMLDANGEPDFTDPVCQVWNGGAAGAPYSARIVRETAFARAELLGESFTFLDRGDTGAGPIAGMHPIFDPVEIVTEWDERKLVQRVAGFIVKRGGERIPLLPSEVLWIRYPHPTKRWKPLAPWKAALYANEVDAYARAWQRGEFRNGARPSAVIFLGDVSSDVHENAQAQYETKIAGASNASRALIVSGPGKGSVQPLTLTPAEMSYLETRAASAEEVMLAFGLRRDVLFGESTYENQAAAKTAAWSETLLPKLDVAGSEVDRQLVPDSRRTVGWDLSSVDALRESQDAAFDRASRVTYPDIVTLDEARGMVGLEPLPAGLGSMTLTAYREHVRTDEAIRLTETLVAGDAGARALLPVMHVRAAGRTRIVRPGARAARDASSASKIERMYARHERIGIAAIGRLADRQLKSVLRNLEQATRADRLDDTLARWAPRLAGSELMPLPGAPEPRSIVHNTGQRMAADDLFDVPFWTAETQRALDDFMTGAWLDGGEYAAETFSVNFDVFDERVLAEMRERLTVLSAQISQTTHDVIEADVLRNGVAAGKSIDDLADDLRTSFADLSSWRAVTIARTETVGGCNAAAHNVAAASGVAVSRRWLAASDARVRPSHERQNGHRLDGFGGTYPNGCRYPGDPEAPADETIRCRCVEIFETD